MKISKELQEQLEGIIYTRNALESGYILSMKYFENGMLEVEESMSKLWRDVEKETGIDISVKNYRLDRVLGEVLLDEED